MRRDLSKLYGDATTRVIGTSIRALIMFGDIVNVIIYLRSSTCARDEYGSHFVSAIFYDFSNVHE